jgi:hypothetical protein
MIQKNITSMKWIPNRSTQARLKTDMKREQASLAGRVASCLALELKMDTPLFNTVLLPINRATLSLDSTVLGCERSNFISNIVFLTHMEWLKFRIVV